MTLRTDKNGSKMTMMWVIGALFTLVMGFGSWGFTYAIGGINDKLEKLNTKVENLPTKIVELQGLDKLLLQRISRIEKDLEELKK